LVHFDCDLYRPTKTALAALWDRVPRGGVVIFDEYAIPAWAGETAAVDEFLADKPEVRLKTFAWTNVPGAYLVKP
ncbi:MAG TPA: TylF/MycF/NovP-related O-methyltransferase, partial [Xanthobacteraceae bacterium]|nr:TylF/MycF/NovP-related O-methyltransferase [Xanthobacteraceae bacterium]